MFSAALDAVIFVGMWQAILIGLGIITGILSVVSWCILGSDGEKLAAIASFFFPILCIACIVTYNIPQMNANIVIAKAVAIELDKYVDKNPESIYNPEVLLREGDTAVKGLVTNITNFSGNLPETIRKLAAGESIVGQKSIDDMTSEELRKEIRRMKGEN
jgi:hypothetical protein